MRRRNNKNESGKIKIHNVRKTKGNTGKDIEKSQIQEKGRERERDKVRDRERLV